MKHSIVCILIIYLNFNIAAQDWIPLNGPMEYVIYDHIVTRKTNELIVLSASGEVLVSSNKGQNWRDISSGIIFEREFFKTTSKFHETAYGKLFLLYAKRFYEFDYINNNWIIRNDSINLNEFTSGPEGIIYAGNETAFYTSENDGISFVKKADWLASELHFECMGNGNNFVKLNNRSPVITFQDDGTGMDSIKMPRGYCDKIFFDTISGYFMNFTSLALYKTKDRGIHWHIADSLRFNPFFEGNVLRSPNGNIFVLNSIIRFSQDGGETWKRDTIIKPLPNNSDYKYLDILNDYTFFFSNKGFNIQDANGASYKVVIPVSNPQVDDLYTYEGDRIICVSKHTEILQRSKNNGMNWDPICPPFDFGLLRDETLDHYGNFYILESDSIIIYNFESKKVLVKTYPFDWTKYKGGFVSKTNKVFLYDGKTIFVSSDEANTWSQHSVKNLDFNSLNCSTTNLLYYDNLDTIFYSYDFGRSWSFFKTKRDVSAVLQLSKNNIFYWLEYDGFKNKLFSSPDFGMTQLQEPDISNSGIYKIDENDTKYYFSYLANPDTLFTIVRPGGTEYISVKGLDYKSGERGRPYIGKNGYIYFVRQHKLPYRTVRSFITKVDNFEADPIKINIYPNPFTENALLTLPESYDRHLKTWTIYNISGKISHKFISTGTELHLSGNELSPGIHFIHVQTANCRTIIDKIIVIK